MRERGNLKKDLGTTSGAGVCAHGNTTSGGLYVCDEVVLYLLVGIWHACRSARKPTKQVRLTNRPMGANLHCQWPMAVDVLRRALTKTF